MKILNRKPWAYYNDFDADAVDWLRSLIKNGLIADGEVDSRSILDVDPGDLKDFTQCHFFAGIGGWSYALRLAGWGDDEPVWTGSPPCQPFSVAGEQKGQKDERHLAPHFVDLVRACRPGVLFGEQVASAEVFGKVAKPTRTNAQEPPQWAWIDDLCDRLEAARYAVGASDFPSAGVGAPHMRQRTFFGAVYLRFADGRVADCHDAGLEGRRQPGRERAAEWFVGAGGLAGRQPDPTNSFWRDADWLLCRDAKWRPVEPRVLKVADGLPESMGHLRMERDGESEDGTESQSNPRQVLQDVRLAPGTPEVQRSLGGQNGLPQAGVLRPGVHGCGLRGHDQGDERQEQPSPVGQGSEAMLRDMRTHGASRPPQGREPAEQRTDQPSEPVRFLSQEGAPPEACYPLANGVKHRAGLLRGYGNAINPHAAAEFIHAFIDALSVDDDIDELL